MAGRDPLAGGVDGRGRTVDGENVGANGFSVVDTSKDGALGAGAVGGVCVVFGGVEKKFDPPEDGHVDPEVGNIEPNEVAACDPKGESLVFVLNADSLESGLAVLRLLLLNAD